MITDGTAVQHGCGHVGSRQKTIVWLPYRMMPSSQCHRTAREAPRLHVGAPAKSTVRIPRIGRSCRVPVAACVCDHDDVFLGCGAR
jgi:hypothetical protein